jgi:hypothetical protein
MKMTLSLRLNFETFKGEDNRRKAFNFGFGQPKRKMCGNFVNQKANLDVKVIFKTPARMFGRQKTNFCVC